jgi:sugar/nucleoside kinase (ribokinase family)
MYDVITVGDIKLDTFVVLNDASVQCALKMPECLLCMEYGAKIVVDVVASEIAGSAPNVAIGLARMKLKTAVFSNMGIDGTRELAIKKLEEEGVSTKFIHIIKGEQSSYSVVLNFKGEKTLLTSHIRHAYHFPKRLDHAKWVYVGEMGLGYDKLFKDVASYVKRHKVSLALNPGTIQIKEKKSVLFDLIKTAHILFVNREEARALTGIERTEMHHLAPALWKLGPKISVITDGKNGAYSFDGKNLMFCPVFPGKRIEATGAGDAFATGFIGALLHKQPVHEGLRWGSVNAASVVGKIGPTAGLLTASQIRSRLKKRPTFCPKAV